jgi:hypothetical protein
MMRAITALERYERQRRKYRFGIDLEWRRCALRVLGKGWFLLFAPDDMIGRGRVLELHWHPRMNPLEGESMFSRRVTIAFEWLPEIRWTYHSGAHRAYADGFRRHQCGAFCSTAWTGRERSVYDWRWRFDAWKI